MQLIRDIDYVPESTGEEGHRQDQPEPPAKGKGAAVEKSTNR